MGDSPVGSKGGARRRLHAGLLALAVALAFGPARASDVGLSAGDAEGYRAAFEALDRGRTREALRHAARGEAPLPAKVVAWAVMLREGSEASFGAIAGFLEANPGWPRRWTLLRRAEEAMPAGLPPEEVLAWFGERAPITPSGAERYAAALEAKGRAQQAEAALHRAWIAGDFPSAADEKAFRARHRTAIDAAADLARLDRLLWEGQRGPARRQAHRVDAGHHALAHARLRLAAMAPGVDGAIARVPRALRDDPGLVFERARWRMRKGRYEDTVALLDPPRPGAPHAARWWPLRHWAARRALARGEAARAHRIAAGHGLEGGLGFAQGEWLAGWTALRFLDEPALARRHFERLYAGVSTPVSRARGAYWSGRAAEALGDAAGARRWYAAASEHITTFYGQLAAARTGAEPFPALPDRPRPGAAARAAFERRELVRVVRLLAALGERRRVGVFVRHLAEGAGDADEAHLVARLARSIGRPDLAVQTARTARRSGIILADHLYPMGLLPAVEEDEPEARALLLAVVRQESGFDPEAVSPAGARGLMQLMPTTAHTLAHRMGLDYSRGRLTADAAYNMRLGAAYLGRLIRRYDGSLLLAVAAYNAGPSRVRAWLEDYGDPRDGGIDPVDWIEGLPFGETRNYVQRIFEALAIYRHRLAPTQVAVALDDSTLLRRAVR